MGNSRTCDSHQIVRSIIVIYMRDLACETGNVVFKKGKLSSNLKKYIKCFRFYDRLKHSNTRYNILLFQFLMLIKTVVFYIKPFCSVSCHYIVSLPLSFLDARSKTFVYRNLSFMEYWGVH